MKKIYFLVLLGVIFFDSNRAQAAYLYFNTAEHEQAVGGVFSVDILVNTENKSMNAVSGSIGISDEFFEFVSFDMSKSQIELWLAKPEYKNNVATFEGVILNPGYSGNAGRVFSMHLKTKKAGVAQLRYSKGVVLANDGKGTDITSKNGTVDLTIKSVSDILEGKLIRTAQAKTVYYVSEGKRYIFLNESMYKSWFSDFSDVIIVNEKELARYLIGGFVKPRPNTMMFKITSDPKVYLVSEKGELRWLINESVASQIFGSNWARKVVDISDAEIAGFKMGTSVTSLENFDQLRKLYTGDLII